ncbi:hypothetical protein LTR27_000682 [Elasticomyces elasticus]|nr:hypothetical protein LTR27_000682 [Elasticomyces elasticus]
MKGSAVFLGLKDWASKALHPQLPLNARESQKLLTTLTGSFRKHLDEVHSPIAGQPQPRLGTVKSSNASPRTLHSSAALADKHLSSILTSPLLSKRSGTTSKADQDFANCKIELHKNTGKDPIALLEEYDARGAATLPIAHLCLSMFEQSLKGLSHERQKRQVAEVEPGRRTLLWLWRSELHQSEGFVDRLDLIDMLTFALMREGLDKSLWDWLSLDMGWKGRILRAMVQSKMLPPYGQKPLLNDALDLFFEAVAARDKAKPGTNLQWLPLHPAGSMLHAALTNQRDRWGIVDSQRYDNFKHLTNAYYRGIRGTAGKWANDALLDLYHPKTPDGLPLYHLFHYVFGPDVSTEDERFLHKIKYAGSASQENHFWYFILTHTVYVLGMQYYTTEAAYVRGLITTNFPDLDRYTDGDLQRFATGELWTSMGRQATREHETSEVEDVRVPFPAFT